MASHRIGHEWTATFVGNVVELHVAILAQQCHGQVTQTAIADGAK